MTPTVIGRFSQWIDEVIGMILKLSHLALTVTFLSIAGCTSSATTKPSEHGEEVTRADAAAPVIVEVVSRDQRIVVHAGTDGPTYTVRDSHGQVVIPSMDLNALQARHPEVARRIDSMNAAAEHTAWAGVE